jgi:hypothetical protein
MKKIILFLSLIIVATLACDLTVSVSSPTSPAPLPTNTMIPALENPTQIPAPATSIPTTEMSVPATEAPTAQPPTVTGITVSYKPLSLVLPSGIASGFSGSQFPRADGQDLPYWELTPGHTVITLDGYLLQGKFHQPQIFVYPATEYAVLVPGAFESMHRMRNIMNVSSASISTDQLPAVPFFNAAQVFASNIQHISFQNGSGSRFLTEYAQYAAPVNNHDLFYHFQGFSDDGEYYVVAIFPITAPVLAETSDARAVLPSGGIAYPDIADPNADFQGYYAHITDLLNATSPESFAPTLNQLDMLIQSMRISP